MTIHWNAMSTDENKSINLDNGVANALPRNKYKQFILTLFLALFGTLCQYFAVRSCSNKYLNNYNSTNNIAIAIANKNLEPDDVLAVNDISLLSSSDKKMISKFINGDNLHRLIGKKIRMSIKQGDIIPQTSLILDSDAKSIPEKIPVGKRLFVLKSSTNDFRGILHRGDKVDVVGHLELPEKGFITKTLLSGVAVAGMDVI